MSASRNTVHKCTKLAPPTTVILAAMSGAIT